MTLHRLAKLMGFKTRLNVGWILLGDENVGSSRIHGINIHNYLLSQGVKSVIYQTNPSMTPELTLTEKDQKRLLSSDTDILIFQKVFGDKAVAFARSAKIRGIKTIFLLSDKHEIEMVNIVDQLVVTSDFLKDYFDANFGTNAVVIEDAIEVPENLCKEHTEKDTLKLIWVGHRDNWRTLDTIRDVLAKMGDSTFVLKTISNHPDADVQWKLDSVFHEILTGDIAVIPTVNDEWGKSKSNNRLTMFMALGMPVVAASIPVYEKIIKNGFNGFLTKDITEWVQCLTLLQDRTTRERIGRQGRNHVIPIYNIDVIGSKWISFLKQIAEC